MSSIVLSEPQIQMARCRQPLVLNMAGQRAGKSFGIGHRTGLYVRYFPVMIGMIAANTYKQLTQSTLVEVRRVWKTIYNYTEYDARSNPGGVYVINKRPPRHFTKYHEFDDYDGIISFRNGCVVFTASLDNYLVHDGKTLGWCELDETKDTKENAVKQVILARLSQPGLYVEPDGSISFTRTPDPKWRPYNPCVINTSPAEGVVDWLVNMFNLTEQEDVINETIFNPRRYYYHEFDTKAVCIYSTYWNESNLPSNYIENRKEHLLSGEVDKFIYGYPFAKVGGEYADYFDRNVHIQPTPRLMGLPDHLTYDFNLVPYMTLINVQIYETETEFQFRIYDEFTLAQPRNTVESVTQAWYDRYSSTSNGVFYYGDAMGTRGVEGFGDNFTRFEPARLILKPIASRDSDRTTRYNIGVNKRRELLNKVLDRRLRVGTKVVTLQVDPRCVNMIKDFQYLKLGPNGKLKETVKEKATGRSYEKLGHCTDALEAILCEILAGFIV